MSPLHFLALDDSWWLPARVAPTGFGPHMTSEQLPVFGVLFLLAGLVLLLTAVGSVVWNRRRVIAGAQSVVGLLVWVGLAWGFYQFTLALPGRSGTFASPGTQSAVEVRPKAAELEAALRRAGATAVEVGKPVGPSPAQAGSEATASQARPAGTPEIPRPEATLSAEREEVGDSQSPAGTTPHTPTNAQAVTTQRNGSERPASSQPQSSRAESETSLKVEKVVSPPPHWGVGPGGDPAGETVGGTEGSPQFVVFRSAPSAQRDKAIREVEERASQWLGQRFARELSGPLAIPLERLAQQGQSNLVMEEFVRQVRLPSGGMEPVPMSVAHLRVKLSPITRLVVYDDHRQQVARDRLMPLLGGVLGVSLVLGAIAVGVRIDRLTHHRRRGLLGLGLFWVLAGALLLLARFSPSSTLVSITGRSQGDIHVEQEGFGLQRTRVEDGDVKIETIAW